MTPNQVNRGHWPTKGNKQKMNVFCIFLVHGKLVGNGPKWSQEVFFPTNPDLVDILGDADFDFEKFYVLKMFFF